MSFLQQRVKLNVSKSSKHSRDLFTLTPSQKQSSRKTRFIFNSPKHPHRGHKSHFSLCIRVPLRRQEKISWNLQHPPMNVKWLGWCRWKKPLKNAIYVGPPVAPALKGRTSFPRENSMCACVYLKGERVESFVKMLVDWKEKNALACYVGCEVWSRLLEGSSDDGEEHWNCIKIYRFMLSLLLLKGVRTIET